MRVRCFLASLSLTFASREKYCSFPLVGEPGRRDRGWERAAAPGSSGDQTALDSSILLLPGRVLMWRESSLKPWASLSASGCPVQAKVPSGWLSVAVRSVRQKFITIIFSPIFFFVRAVGRK